MERNAFRDVYTSFLAEQDQESLEALEILKLHPVNDGDIENAQSLLESRLPELYRYFLIEYGGGSIFRLDLLYPAALDPYEDLVLVNQEEAFEGFVAVAPVGTGDWWGFVSKNGVCDDPVYFWDHEDGTLVLDSDDFLEFLVKRGLGQGAG